MILAILESRSHLGPHIQLLQDFDIKKLVVILCHIHGTIESWDKVKNDMGYRLMTVGDLQEVGQTLFILGRHLIALDDRIAREFDEEAESQKSSRAVAFFQQQTGQVEIVRENALERLYFPIPEICHLLPLKDKENLVNEVNRHDQLSKLEVWTNGASVLFTPFQTIFFLFFFFSSSPVCGSQDFVARSQDLICEMKWQKRLQETPRLHWFSSHFSQSRKLSFIVTLAQNCLILSSFPLDEGSSVSFVGVLSQVLAICQLLLSVSVATGFFSGSSKTMNQRASIFLTDTLSVYYTCYVFLAFLSFSVTPYFSSLLVRPPLF